MNSLRRILHALRVWAQELEPDLGISGAQVLVLEKLDGAPAQSLNHLAARTLTRKAAVSAVVSRLVDRGLVRRKASLTNGHNVVLSLTAAGRRCIERAAESPGRRVSAALKRLPRRELDALARLFEHFSDELGIRGAEARLMLESDTGERQSAGRPRRRTPARTRRARA